MLNIYREFEYLFRGSKFNNFDKKKHKNILLHLKHIKIMFHKVFLSIKF